MVIRDKRGRDNETQLDSPYLELFWSSVRSGAYKGWFGIYASVNIWIRLCTLVFGQGLKYDYNLNEPGYMNWRL